MMFVQRTINWLILLMPWLLHVITFSTFASVSLISANIYYMEEQALWELWHDFLGDLA